MQLGWVALVSVATELDNEGKELIGKSTWLWWWWELKIWDLILWFLSLMNNYEKAESWWKLMILIVGAHSLHIELFNLIIVLDWGNYNHEWYDTINYDILQSSKIILSIRYFVSVQEFWSSPWYGSLLRYFVVFFNWMMGCGSFAWSLAHQHIAIP